MLLRLSPCFSSCLLGLKRKFESFSGLALITLFILCFLVDANQGGVIKKRDTNITETPSGNTVFDIKESEVTQPTIITIFNNDSVAAFSTKLSTDVAGGNSLVTESSKELSNNEILISEAKQLTKEAEITKQTINETLTKSNNQIENDNLQNKFYDLQQVSQTGETKQEKLQDLNKNSKELDSNDIKEEKIEKLKVKSYDTSNQNELLQQHSENTAFLENKLNSESSKPTFGNDSGDSESTTQISFNESGDLNHKTAKNLVIEKPATKLDNESKTLDNSIANSKEKLDFEVTTISPEENTLSPIESNTLLNSENKFNIVTPKTKSLETSTPKAGKTESFEVLEENSLKTLDDNLITQNQTKQLQDSQNKEEQEETLINKTTAATFFPTTQPTLLFEGETTSSKLAEHNEDLFTPQITTFKPVKISIKEGIKELTADQEKDQIQATNNTLKAVLGLKEKKPKFINDNSTNAQQLNLPNNAEVWSLAAMKSLPKTNITMATAHAYNETIQDLKTQQNTSTIANNNNSEKNLLDWSQIMMDKELSVTTRNEQPELTERNDKNFFATENAEEETITKNSLLEQEPLTTSTMSPVLMTTTTTILSNNNENLNFADKKVVENMNNHIEMLTATFASTNANVDNNPFNTSLNIEPNLNEINLTSNQTKVDLNNEQHTTTEITTAGKQTAHSQPETTTMPTTMTSTATAMPTSIISTLSTTATAVYDDMTTVEQISSETTTVSILEATKQNTSLTKVVISEQQQQEQQQNITNNIYNVNKEKTNSASHQNELDNNVLEKNQFNENENSDLITKTTTTVIPITTFRPKNLAITSTTTKAETFEQEVDQKSNEIQTNSTNTQQQQSIIKFDLQTLNTTTKTIADETTLKTLTTTTATPSSTATEHLTTTTAISENANSHTSSPRESETTTTTTSYSADVIINDTTETNLETSVAATTTTTQTTPKQETEEKNKGVNNETTTGSVALIDNEFENKEYQNSTTATTTETNLLAKTSTETPVVFVTEEQKDIYKSSSSTPTTETATATTTSTQHNIIVTTTEQVKSVNRESILKQKEEEEEEDAPTATTIKIMNNTQETTTISTSITLKTIKVEETNIHLLDDTTTAATIEPHSDTISTTTSSYHLLKTTTPSTPLPSSSTLPSPIPTKIEEIYNVINSTTTEAIQNTTQQLLTEIVEETTSSSSESDSSSTATTIVHLKEMLSPVTTATSQTLPNNDIGHSSHLPTLTTIMGGNSGNMYTKNSQASGETDINVIIAITVSVIGVVALILLVGFLYLMRKRQKQTSYSQRCRPVGLDDYTIDNASVGGSMRKSNALRASKRTYGNLAFDDPTLRHNPMGVHELAKFAQEKLRIFEEFHDVPQITSRLDEVPTGCEDKNRYANVLPLPETRIILQRLNDDEKSEYINANYVTGPKDPPNYYIACQAPLEATVEDFWRMIWEQQSRVIIQATDLIEFGVEKCAEYLPPSVTLDNHSSFGDFQITLQNREVKDKYAISTLLLKHTTENATRELTHYWYKWPETGVPAEEAPIIAMLLEARSSLISYAIEQANEDKEKVATLKSAEEGTVTSNKSSELPTNNSNGSSANGSTGEINGNISMVHIKKTARNQGPLTVHCSPGTGRTGTIIACDIALRSLETTKRIVDIPQIVYSVRRGRASAVLTKEQYEFIYKVANMYAAKITNPTNYN